MNIKPVRSELDHKIVCVYCGIQKCKNTLGKCGIETVIELRI